MDDTKVPVGPSEYAALLGMVASLLMSFFGKDWGLGHDAPSLGILAAGLISVGTSVARAFKHHSLTLAATTRYVAQLGTAFQTANTPGVQNSDVTIALATIQNAPGQADVATSSNVSVIPDVPVPPTEGDAAP